MCFLLIKITYHSLRNVDPKIYTKYLIVKSLIWRRDNDVGNNIFRKQRCNQIPVSKYRFY